ncbi:MAG: hypothetical protein L7U64_10055, partial [Luminiphilus sp.]|nr:hypothetical protein [Luminiphilus sp.]
MLLKKADGNFTKRFDRGRAKSLPDGTKTLPFPHESTKQALAVFPLSPLRIRLTYFSLYTGHLRTDINFEAIDNAHIPAANAHCISN